MTETSTETRESPRRWPEPDKECGPRALPAAPRRTATLARVRRIALTAWVMFVVGRVALLGFSFDRSQLLILMCAGLAAASIGRRGVLTVVRDWLPFAVALLVYDLSRKAATVIGMPTHWHFAPDIDRRLFGGTMPTVWLQSHLKEAVPPWWEVVVSAVYMSFFVFPYVVACVLWLRDRATWLQFAYRFVGMSFVALGIYILFPAAPPWAAARCGAGDVAGGPDHPRCMSVPPRAGGGLLGAVHPHHPGAYPYVERLSTRGWDRLHLTAARSLVDAGQSQSNLVAAVPSLHAGLTLLVVLFLWGRVRAVWRPLLALYALAMAFVLVYAAEHYVIDVLLGWVLAVAVLVAADWCERALRRRKRHARRRRRSQPSAVPMALPSP